MGRGLSYTNHLNFDGHQPYLWNGDVMSDFFIAINGGKQGWVVSPVLFCIYFDDLLEYVCMYHHHHMVFLEWPKQQRHH